jgi:hypothetical protein
MWPKQEVSRSLVSLTRPVHTHTHAINRGEGCRSQTEGKAKRNGVKVSIVLGFRELPSLDFIPKPLILIHTPTSTLYTNPDQTPW